MESLFLGRYFAEFTGDEKILGTTEKTLLAFRDFHNEQRLRLRQLPEAMHQFDHRRGFNRTDLKVGSCDTAEHVGERRQIPCLTGLEFVEFSDDAADRVCIAALRTRGACGHATKPFEDRRHGRNRSIAAASPRDAERCACSLFCFRESDDISY